MKKSRFTTEQIIAILQEHAAGAEPGDLVRRHGISRATLYHGTNALKIEAPPDVFQLEMGLTPWILFLRCLVAMSLLAIVDYLLQL